MSTPARPLPSRRAALVALVAGAAGFAAALGITAPPGPGLDDDSKDYMGGAMSLAAGQGLRVPTAWWPKPVPSEPLGHFPPGYPALLAVPVRAGVRPIAAARATQAVAAGITTGGVALLAGAVSTPAGIGAAALLLITPDIALVHGRVLSEPLFLACFVITLLLLVLREDRPGLAGLAGAATCLVRYAGVGIVGAAGLLALCGGGGVRARLKRFALAVGPAFVTLGAWSLVLRHVRAHVRDPEWHGTLLPALALGWATLRDWMAPGLPEQSADLAGLLALAGFAGFALLARSAVRRGEDAASRRARRLGLVTGVVAASYVAFLCASRLLADPWLPFDERILSPLFVLAPPVAAVGIVRGWPRWGPKVRAAAGALLGLWLAGSALLMVGTVRQFLGDGWGYADKDFLTGGTVQWLETAAADRPLFSNNPAAIWFSSGRSGWFLPAATDPDTALRSFGDTLRARRGLVVGFTDGDESIIQPDTLARRLGLVLMARFDDGAVWKPAPGGP